MAKPIKLPPLPEMPVLSFDNFALCYHQMKQYGEQCALVAIEADRQSQDREDDPLQPAVNWLNGAIVDLTATDIQRRLFVEPNRAQRMLDHARRVEGEGK